MKEQPNYKLSKKTDAVIEDISKNSNSWQRRKNSRPPEIIDAARKLLEEEGIKGLSMMNISKAAGVSEATVYKYFNDKNDLLNQVVNDWL